MTSRLKNVNSSKSTTSKTTSSELTDTTLTDVSEDKDVYPSNNIPTNELYKFIDLYFKKKNTMYSHLYNSFDKLLDEDIPNYLTTTKCSFFEKMTKDEIIEYGFDFSNIAVRPPFIDIDNEIMLPQKARINSLTYASKLIGTVTQYKKVTNILSNVVTKTTIGNPEHEYHITNIPIMVRSKYCSLTLLKNPDPTECRYDPGGYFIIKGNEKVILSLERMIFNKPLVFIKKEGTISTHTVQINSKSFKNDTMQITNIVIRKDASIIIKVPIFTDVSAFIVMRALGIESDRDIIDYCVYDKNDIDMMNLIRISLEHSKSDKNTKILTQNDAQLFLMQKIKILKKYSAVKETEQLERKMHLNQLLTDNLLPHVESERLIDKGFFIGYMINRLLQCYLGRVKPDDRDNYINKNIELPGQLIFEIFKQYFKKTLNECNKFFKKRNNNDDAPLNIITQIKPSTIELGLMVTLSTGTWNKRKGVAQPLPRFTYQQTLTALRRINSPSLDASTNKITGPRHLHPSIVGPLCITGDSDVLVCVPDLNETCCSQCNGNCNTNYAHHNITTKKMVDITNDDIVMTVNKETLEMTPSKIHDKFSKISEKLLQFITIDGQKLKCTPEHPLLIKKDGKHIMINAEDILITDELVLLHTEIDKISIKSFVKSNIKDYTECDLTTIGIESILTIPNEMVYDFTTVDSNHSFVANSIVVSNCYIEVPEGAKVGLVKNLSLIGTVTVIKNSQKNVIKNILRTKVIPITDVSPKQFGLYTRVYLNGNVVGLTNKPRELYNELKNMKYNGSFDPHISISHCIKSEIECKDIRINCDSGRIIHPVFRVIDNKILLTQDMIDLIDVSEKTNPTKITTLNEFMVKFPGVLEYIDTDEKYTAMLAVFPYEVEKMRKRMDQSINNLQEEDFKNVMNRYDDYTYIKYTHCEIHPSLLIGVVVSNIPFADRNQGPRNMYQYSQAKQALGIFSTNYRHRLDLSYILYHSQRPIVTTRSMKYTNTDKLPAGENIVIAIACFTGYNQEDSNLLSKSAIDRGLFRSTTLRKESTTIQKNQATSQDDIFIKPDVSQVTGVKAGTYNKVNEMGYTPEETVLEHGDIILAKLSPIQPSGPNKKIFKDSSIFYKGGFPGVVDKVYTNIINHEGYEMRKVRTRSERIPIVGDKFCSKMGQKGVNGLQLSAADMLFTTDGMTIDMLINPNCMPSRMTMGQLVEILVGKIAACEGQEIDGTIFNNISIDAARERLASLGYQSDGCEYLYNGMTGKKLKHMIFTGPCYYQRLKHMVADKIHSRCRGPQTMLTRQPPEGRALGGGLRFGEMERDAMIAHGLGKFLKERLLETSDVYHCHVCNKCGLFAQRMLRQDTINSPQKSDVYFCPACKNYSDISKIRIPYSFKLLCQELLAINICPRIYVKKDPSDY